MFSHSSTPIVFFFPLQGVHEMDVQWGGVCSFVQMFHLGNSGFCFQGSNILAHVGQIRGV
jgi:hypothetical protein